MAIETKQKEQIERVYNVHWKIRELSRAMETLQQEGDWEMLEEVIRSACKYDPDGNKKQAQLADIYNLLDQVKDAWA